MKSRFVNLRVAAGVNLFTRCGRSEHHEAIYLIVYFQ